MAGRVTATETWPALPLEEWRDTQETLHLWMQVVGKVKLELTPFLNEWWNVAFTLTPRGLTTGPIPAGDETFAVDFDFIDHTLFIHASDGRTRSMPLIPRSVADFYAEFLGAVRAMGIDVEINPLPAEIPNPISCEIDTNHASYDADAAQRWWRIMVQTEKVLQRYRSPFVGKNSPVNFYWGSFDLAATRFSGRPAEPPAGAPLFLQLAENQENISCGFWPGNVNMTGITLGEPAFYSYAYPEPAGFKEASVRPDAAYYDPALGEFVLRYEDVRQAAAPGEVILDFFQSVYETAADLGGWDRQVLEQTPPNGVKQ